MNTQNETTLKVNVVVAAGGTTGGGAPGGGVPTPGASPFSGNQPTNWQQQYQSAMNAQAAARGGSATAPSSSWQPNFGAGNFGNSAGGQGAWGSGNPAMSSHPGNIPPQLIPPPQQPTSGMINFMNYAGIGQQKIGGIAGGMGNMLSRGLTAGGSFMANPMGTLARFAPLGAGMTAGAAVYGAAHATDSFMRSYNPDGKAAFGHGDMYHSASGQNHLGDVNRFMEGAVGGGRTNARGDFKSWDHFQQVEQTRHSERLRRSGMQADYEGFRSAELGNRFNLQDAQVGATGRLRGIAANQGFDASSEYMALQKPFLESVQASNKVIFGDDAQAQRQYVSSFNQTREQSLSHNEKVNSLLASKDENSLEQQKVMGQMSASENNLRDIRSRKQEGDKKIISPAEVAEAERLKGLMEQMLALRTKQNNIEHSIRDSTRDQQRALLGSVRGRLSEVQSNIGSEEMSKRGSLESFGMMEKGDQEHLKNIAGRWKAGGFDQVTPEEARQLMNTPLAEDVQIASRKRGQDAGFDDLFKGSRQETRMGALNAEQSRLIKLETSITKELNANVSLDAEEFAKKAVKAMAPLISKIEAQGRIILQLQTDMQDQRNQTQGNRPSPDSGVRVGWMGR